MKPGELISYTDSFGKIWLGIILEKNEHSDFRKVLWHDGKISSILSSTLTLASP